MRAYLLVFAMLVGGTKVSFAARTDPFAEAVQEAQIAWNEAETELKWFIGDNTFNAIIVSFFTTYPLQAQEFLLQGVTSIQQKVDRAIDLQSQLPPKKRPVRNIEKAKTMMTDALRKRLRTFINAAQVIKEGPDGIMLGKELTQVQVTLEKQIKKL